MPLPAINISAVVGVKGVHLTARSTVCQPEVNTAVDDLIWSDDGSSRLALIQGRAGVNTKCVSDARRRIQFIV